MLRSAQVKVYRKISKQSGIGAILEDSVMIPTIPIVNIRFVQLTNTKKAWRYAKKVLSEETLFLVIETAFPQSPINPRC